ncbi:MAG: ABC transporter permease, partial [Vicinamibacterales bacterium]
ELFPGGHAVGGLVKVNQVWLRVVGVLADRDLGKDNFQGVSLGSDANRVFVPLASAEARFKFEPMEDRIDRFLLRIDDPARLAPDARVLGALMGRRHGGADDYALIVPQRLFHQNQQTQRMFDIVMGAIAGVSLLVGGIGIMNIMLASVLERTREIGVRRAIGARRTDIIRQFVMETTMIAVAGGTMGLVLGASMSRLIANFAGWSTIISSSSLALAFSVSVLIGLVSGVYPAMKASRLDPVQALHYE